MYQENMIEKLYPKFHKSPEILENYAEKWVID